MNLKEINILHNKYFFFGGGGIIFLILKEVFILKTVM